MINIVIIVLVVIVSMFFFLLGFGLPYYTNPTSIGYSNSSSSGSSPTWVSGTVRGGKKVIKKLMQTYLH